MAAIFEFVRMQTTISATLSFLRPGERPFLVTGKAGADQRQRHGAPWLLWFLLALSLVSAGWFAGTLSGLTFTSYPIHWAVYGAMIWLVVNAGLLVAAIARVRSDHFATDRRSAVRLRVSGGVSLDEGPGELLDVSVGGALVRSALAPLEVGAHRLLLSFLNGEKVELACEERGRQAVGDYGALVSLRFAGGQDREIGRMSANLLGGQPLSVHSK